MSPPGSAGTERWGCVGRSKPSGEKTVGSLMMDRVTKTKTGSRGGAEETNTHMYEVGGGQWGGGCKEFSFSHLIIPPPLKIGLHLWMKKIPLCIQRCLST